MSEFLLGATGFVLLMVGIGLWCILRGPGDADRMMSAQLFGTGGIAALLLLGAAMDVGSVVDVALVLAVLAAFAAIAFVKAGVAGDAAVDAMDARQQGEDPR